MNKAHGLFTQFESGSIQVFITSLAVILAAVVIFAVPLFISKNSKFGRVTSTSILRVGGTALVTSSLFAMMSLGKVEVDSSLVSKEALDSLIFLNEFDVLLGLVLGLSLVTNRHKLASFITPLAILVGVTMILGNPGDKLAFEEMTHLIVLVIVSLWTVALTKTKVTVHQHAVASALAGTFLIATLLLNGVLGDRTVRLTTNLDDNVFYSVFGSEVIMNAAYVVAMVVAHSMIWFAVRFFKHSKNEQSLSILSTLRGELTNIPQQLPFTSHYTAALDTILEREEVSELFVNGEVISFETNNDADNLYDLIEETNIAPPSEEVADTCVPATIIRARQSIGTRAPGF